MKKREFLDLLKFYLKDMPSIMIEDIISDYEEHFQIAMENGKTEEQICKELGSPELIANDYIHNEIGKFRPIINETENKKQENNTNYAYTINEKNKKNKSNILIIILCIISAIIFIPPLFGIGIAMIASVFAVIITIVALIFSLIVSIFATGFGIIVFGIGVPVAGLFGNLISIPDMFLLLHPVTRFFLSISCILLGVLIIYAGVMIVYGIFNLIKKLVIAIIWTKSKRRKFK